MRRPCLTALSALLVIGLAAPAVAQQNPNVRPSDIEWLAENAYQASLDVSELRRRDDALAGELQAELDVLREDVIYLKVKLRREESVARSEYSEVRDRIEDLRTRALGAPASVSAAPASPPVDAGARTLAAATAPDMVEIPAGSEVDVRLTNELNSGTVVVEDRFEATTLIDLNVNSRLVVPAGSVLRGVVTNVEPATRTNRTARLTVSFDQVTVNARAYPLRGTVTRAIEGEGIRGEAGRIGTGAGVGAIIGGILGGFRGTLAGILIGAGGTIAATEGRQVELPQGSVLRVRIDSPVQIDTTPNSTESVPFGDSAVWGAGVEQQQRFGDRLEALYHEHGQATRVYSLGIVAAGPFQYLRMLAEVPPAVGAGRVVVAFAMNDMPLTEALWRRIEESGLVFGRGSPSIRLVGDTVAELLASDVHAYHDYVVDSYREDHPSFPARWALLERQLDELARLAEERSERPPLLMILPLMVGFEGYPLEAAHARLATAARGAGFEVLDMLPIFRTELVDADLHRIAPDDTHFDAETHDLGARTLYRTLGPSASGAAAAPPEARGVSLQRVASSIPRPLMLDGSAAEMKLTFGAP